MKGWQENNASVMPAPPGRPAEGREQPDCLPQAAGLYEGISAKHEVLRYEPVCEV